MDTSGTLTTLTLPTGVTIDSTKRPRMTVFGNYIVIVNSPNRPITVDTENTVRLLCPRPPRTVPVLSAVTGGTLSGTYKVKQTFLVLDVDGNLIAESDFGPTSLTQALTSEYLSAGSLDVSTDTVSATRLYRNATLGTVFFPWIDIDGNVQTSIQDDLSDAGLALVAAPTLGSPPSTLTNIATFRFRGWGVSATEIDTLRFTDANRIFSWPITFGLTIGTPGSDDRGITGIISRREFLAVGRQNSLYQISGTTPTNFQPVVLKEHVGIESPDSIVVFRDVAYWLAKDGVYAWSDEGIRCVSDGKVRSWFTTTTYFNRAEFKNAVGSFDPLTKKYRLHLAATGQTALNRWIEFDTEDNTWWGPHLTSDFTPSWGTILLDADNLKIPVIGSTAGFLYRDQATRTDGTATGIALNVDSKFHDMNTPKIEKFFGHLAVTSKIQSAGTLSIVPSPGGLDAGAGATISADMTKGYERLRRLGTGRFVQLNFAHSTAAQDIELYGYELPFHELGQR